MTNGDVLVLGMSLASQIQRQLWISETLEQGQWEGSVGGCELWLSLGSTDLKIHHCCQHGIPRMLIQEQCYNCVVISWTQDADYS